MDRQLLERLIDRGLTQRQLATELGCSQTTVRYWLQRWDLRTRSAARALHAQAARTAGVDRLERECKRHGLTVFVLDVEGIYRCTRCRADRVARRRRRVKEILVAEAGGRCVLCGYARHPAALQFHHLEPSSQGFGIGSRGLSRAIEKLRSEARKCVLLCSNCHAEVEIGFAALPPDIALDRG
jgi:DNA-directed RNA polymerase specialized sigma24 family protein